MTVSSTSSRVVYQGNGTTTAFPFAFKVLQAADLVVTYTDATGTDYTLSPSQYSATGFGLDGGGSVTYLLNGSPIASGTTLTIQRSITPTQPTSISNQGAMWPAVIEGALDRVTMIGQGMLDLLGRSLKIAASDGTALNPLPNATQRANSFLAFDGSGQPYAAQSISLASVSTWLATNFLPQTTALGARTALGAMEKFCVSPFDYGAAGDGMIDDHVALQAALNAAVAAGTSLLLPHGHTFACGQQLVVNQGTVAIFGGGPTSCIKFTNASSSGFYFTPRAYNAVTGVFDRVMMDNFHILHSAVHTDAAVKIIYSAHTASAEHSFFISRVRVRPAGVFGTSKFNRGFHFSNAYIGSLSECSFIGASSYASDAVYINNCIDIDIYRFGATYATNATHITTGDGGVAQPQCEGIHITGGEFFNVTTACLIDGLSTMASNAIDTRIDNLHCSGWGHLIDWTGAAQSQITAPVFYANTQGIPAFRLYSCTSTDIQGGQIVSTFTPNGSGSSGVWLGGSTGQCRIAPQYIGGFDVGVTANNTTSNNSFVVGVFQGCTTGISDAGAHNSDLGATLVAANGAFQGFTGIRMMPAYTVVNLPATAPYGAVCYAINGRKHGEGAGSGTGVLVFGDSGNWCAVDTGLPVAA